MHSLCIVDVGTFKCMNQMKMKLTIQTVHFELGATPVGSKLFFLNKKRHDICIFNVSEKDFLNIFF